MYTRRNFIKTASLAAAAVASPAFASNLLQRKNDFFEISLAQWSLHKALFAGKLTNMDFPLKAKRDFGIDIVEYVSVFFQGKEADKSYVNSLKQITKDNGIRNNLIMVDGEGDLGDLDEKKRMKAVENHYKWVETAKVLGCKSIRVNAFGKGTAEEVKAAVVDGLRKLTNFASKSKINVIVENHGSYSSNGKWLAEVMREVNHPFCGTLPDFGNFRISETEKYDLYQGVQDLLPFAKAISAKTFRFDDSGNEPDIDYFRLFDMIRKSGFKGVVGIEWEGNSLSEDEGILATKRLLERVKKHFG